MLLILLGEWLLLLCTVIMKQLLMTHNGCSMNVTCLVIFSLMEIVVAIEVVKEWETGKWSELW